MFAWDTEREKRHEVNLIFLLFNLNKYLLDGKTALVFSELIRFSFHRPEKPTIVWKSCHKIVTKAGRLKRGLET